MITKKAVNRGSGVKVTFTLPVGAERIAVAGDFNDWEPTATPLRKRGDSRSASVTLEPGRRYAFRYVDEHGRWFNDEAADGYEFNSFGGHNGVVDLTDNP